MPIQNALLRLIQENQNLVFEFDWQIYDVTDR